MFHITAKSVHRITENYFINIAFLNLGSLIVVFIVN